MTFANLSRRRLLYLGLLASIGGITSCGKVVGAPRLRAFKGTLPKKLVRGLPSPWRFEAINTQLKNDSFDTSLLKTSDLIALGDGWLKRVPSKSLQPIGLKEDLAKFDYQAIDFLKGLSPELSKCVLPIGVSPLVMLFKRGDPWLSMGQDGWEVLLDPSLKGRVVLPNSPRIIISIAQRIAAPFALRSLRRQVNIFDDKNALNWLLSGDARVAVLPLSRCWRSLGRDPRLSIAIPKTGMPLDWTVLIRPKLTREPFPQNWLEKLWTPPLLSQLLGEGWIPPLPRNELRKAIDLIPEAYQSILLPPERVWEKCWSFRSLNSLEEKELEELWLQSSP